MTYDPWQFPDNPFDYTSLISSVDGIGSIPDKKMGTKIAIIGAGCGNKDQFIYEEKLIKKI